MLRLQGAWQEMLSSPSVEPEARGYVCLNSSPHRVTLKNYTELDDLVPIKEVKAELHALATTLNQSQEAHYTTLMLKLQDAAEERKILYQKLEIIEGWLMYPQALTIGQSAIGQSAIVDPPPTGEALTVEGLYQVQG